VRRFWTPLCALWIAAAANPAFALEALEARTRAFRLLTDGTKAYEEGRYLAAIEMLEEATGISLNSFQGFYYLGLAYNAVRRYEDAVQALDVALILEPNHLQSHVAMGDAYLKLGNLREASVEYHKGIELQAAYAPAYDGLARLAEAQGKPGEAEKLYQDAIRVNPGYPEPYLHLGDLYLRDGRVDQAVDLFLKAIQVRPDFADAFNRLGAAYAEQKLFDEAMAAIEKARELRPLDAAHPLAMGKVLFQLGIQGRAEEQYRAAIRLDPDLLETYLRLAELYRSESRYAEAMEVLEQGALRPVDDVVMVQRLRDARERYGRERAQIDALGTRAARGESLTLDDALVLARLYDDLGDPGRSASVLKRAIGEERVEAAVRFELGYYLLRDGKHEEAREIFSFLTEIDPRDTAALLNLGIAAAALGRLSEAEDAYQRALRVDPRLADAYLYLGNLYIRGGQPKQATEAYRQFLQVQQGGRNVERVRRILEMLGQEGAG
jgi:tetratricopeptide (TPR) repeat protein